MSGSSGSYLPLVSVSRTALEERRRKKNRIRVRRHRIHVSRRDFPAELASQIFSWNLTLPFVGTVIGRRGWLSVLRESSTRDDLLGAQLLRRV